MRSFICLGLTFTSFLTKVACGANSGDDRSEVRRIPKPYDLSWKIDFCNPTW